MPERVTAVRIYKEGMSTCINMTNLEEHVLTSNVCIPSFASLTMRGCTSAMVSDTTYKTETSDHNLF